MNELEQLRDNASSAADLLKSMANENRLMILCTLIEGEKSVGDLNQAIPLSQSALSQHLAGLREKGLVNTRRDSQVIYYRLAGDEAIKVIDTLKSIYCPE